MDDFQDVQLTFPKYSVILSKSCFKLMRRLHKDLPDVFFTNQRQLMNYFCLNVRGNLEKCKIDWLSQDSYKVIIDSLLDLLDRPISVNFYEKLKALLVKSININFLYVKDSSIIVCIVDTTPARLWNNIEFQQSYFLFNVLTEHKLNRYT